MADHFWEYQFSDTPAFTDTFDELPLWSASFGLMMLEHLRLTKNSVILDIGSGAGFPLLEIAERAGSTCRCIGLDPWVNANWRAQNKISSYGITNAEIITGSAEQIPLGDSSVDLIVSNLGINNFEDPVKVISECHRVLKDKGRIAVTTNLNGHWIEFYRIFEETLAELNSEDVISKLSDQQKHRGTLTSCTGLFEQAAFRVIIKKEDSFRMFFTDGTAFLNHHFVKLGWMLSWSALIEPADREKVFTLLESKLNNHAASHGGLTLTVPMAYLEAEKQTCIKR